MRHFTVTVHPNRVQIDEQEKPTRTPEFRAVVDGEDVLYEMKKHHNTSRVAHHWRARGSIEMQYHAKTLGTNVRFQHVHPQKCRSREEEDKELSLLWQVNHNNS